VALPGGLRLQPACRFRNIGQGRDRGFGVALIQHGNEGVDHVESVIAEVTPILIGLCEVIAARNYPLCTLEPSIALRPDFSCCIP
jgi:hypothetical protein